MSKKTDDADQAQPSDDSQDNQPQSLVGSGTPMVTVRAAVGVLGLQSGQVATLAKTDEVVSNIENGNLIRFTV